MFDALWLVMNDHTGWFFVVLILGVLTWVLICAGIEAIAKRLS
jgi:hypothetical protein